MTDDIGHANRHNVMNSPLENILYGILYAVKARNRTENTRRTFLSDTKIETPAIIVHDDGSTNKSTIFF